MTYMYSRPVWKWNARNDPSLGLRPGGDVSETVDRMYEQWRRETEPGHESLEPTSWDDATEDLGGFPELKDNHDREMELQS